MSAAPRLTRTCPAATTYSACAPATATACGARRTSRCPSKWRPRPGCRPGPIVAYCVLALLMLLAVWYAQQRKHRARRGASRSSSSSRSATAPTSSRSATANSGREPPPRNGELHRHAHRPRQPPLPDAAVPAAARRAQGRAGPRHHDHRPRCAEAHQRPARPCRGRRAHHRSRAHLAPGHPSGRRAGALGRRRIRGGRARAARRTRHHAGRAHSRARRQDEMRAAARRGGAHELLHRPHLPALRSGQARCRELGTRHQDRGPGACIAPSAAAMPGAAGSAPKPWPTLHVGHRGGRVERRRIDRQRRHHRTCRPRAAATTPSTRCAYCARRVRVESRMDTEIRDALARSLPDLAHDRAPRRRDPLLRRRQRGARPQQRRRRNPRSLGRRTCGPSRSPRTCCRPCAASSRRASPPSIATRTAISSSRCASRSRDSTACSWCAAISAPAPRPTIPASTKRAGGAGMLPHRDGFEKSLRMALDMAALREDTVGRRADPHRRLHHLPARVRFRARQSPARSRRASDSRQPPRRTHATCRASRACPTTSSAWCSRKSVRAPMPTTSIEAIIKALRHPVDLDGQIFQLAPQAGVTLSGTDGARASELIDRALTTLDAGRRQGADRLVTFYSDTLRLASLTRLDWQEELTQAIQKDELELHYQPRLTAGDARDRRGRGLPALAAQDPRPGAHLRVPAHRRALRAFRAARPLGAAARLPRSRDARAARLSRTARLGERGPPVPFGGKPRRRRHQFRARSRHRTLAPRSRNHRADAVHRSRRASPPCTSCAARACACSSTTSARATCRSGGCATARSTAS